LVRNLIQKGHDVTVFDKSVDGQADGENVKFVEGDIRDFGSLVRAMIGCDVAYNLVAEHRDDVRPVSLYREVNVGGAETFCRAASEVAVRNIVFTSSVAVYGTHDSPMDENTPHCFFNEYGKTKSEAEAVYERWQRSDGSNRLFIVRPTVVFGAGNRGNVFNLLRQIKNGPFFMLGKGDNIKSMACVENVAEFLSFLLDLDSPYYVFNYSDVPNLAVREIVAIASTAIGKRDSLAVSIPMSAGLFVGKLFDLLSSVSGARFPISEVRIRKFCSPSEVCSDRAFQTGFRASIALEAALQDMVLKSV